MPRPGSRAESLGVAGWRVRDADDGSVEAVFEGPDERVDSLVDWCRRGPAGAERRRRSTWSPSHARGREPAFESAKRRPRPQAVRYARAPDVLHARSQPCAHPRRPRLRAGRTTGCSWPSSRRSGRVATSINLVVYTALLKGAGLHYAAAATCSFLVAVTNNYTWNRLWTFHAQRGHVGWQGLRFLVVALVAYAANLALLAGSSRSGWTRCSPRRSRSSWSPRSISSETSSGRSA